MEPLSSIQMSQRLPDSKSHYDDDSMDHSSTRPNANSEIGLSALGLVVPMLALTATLLTFIMLYRVDKATVLAISPDKIEANAIYVDADSTLLVFVSSWMSSIVPLLTACAITLATYPIAQQLLWDSNKGRHRRLLTSFQLSIAIKFANGSIWASLLNLLQYRISWGRPVARHGIALISITIVTVVMIILGIGVLAADTWLHLATKSVNLVRLSTLNSSDALYSLSVAPQCSTTNNSYTALSSANLSCTVSTLFSAAFMDDEVAALRTLNNQSEKFAVLSYSHDPQIHYLSVNPATINDSHDYNATTFAFSTTCRPISRQCGLVLTSENTTFNCSNGAFWMKGKGLANLGYSRQSYRYSDMSDSVDDGVPNGVDNPFFTAGAAQNQLSTVIPENRTHDPDLVTIADSVMAAVFFCNNTVFDAEYEVVQGRISRFVTTPSNVSTTNMFASGIIGTTFGTGNGMIAMDIAAPDVDSAQDYANAFADSLSAIALASGAASVRQAPIVTGQERNTLLVSQVPKAPLILLISLDFIFVVVGLILLLLASSTSKEARAVQFRLSIAGIVANLFEGRQARAKAGAVQQLFGEFHGTETDARIKVQRTSAGGFVFESVDHINEIQENDMSIYDVDRGMSHISRSFPVSPLRSEGLLVEDKDAAHPITGQTWI